MIQGLNLCENILHVTNMGNLGKNKFSFVTEIGFKMRRKITKKLRLFRENIFEKPISSRTVFQIDDGESDEFFPIFIFLLCWLLSYFLLMIFFNVVGFRRRTRLWNRRVRPRRSSWSPSTNSACRPIWTSASVTPWNTTWAPSRNLLLMYATL